MIALDPLPSLVPRNAQRNAVLWPELLQLGHDARGDDGRRLRKQQIHEGLLEVEFPAHGVGEEVCVDEDAVGGTEGFVGHEEHGGGGLGDLALGLFRVGFLLGFEGAGELVFGAGKEG